MSLWDATEREANLLEQLIKAEQDLQDLAALVRDILLRDGFSLEDAGEVEDLLKEKDIPI